MGEGRPLLTEPEAANHLRVCARTLRKARRDGKLTYVLIGRAVRYTMSDLEQFIERARQDDQQCPKPQIRRSNRGNASTGQILPFTARR